MHPRRNAFLIRVIETGILTLPKHRLPRMPLSHPIYGSYDWATSSCMKILVSAMSIGSEPLPTGKTGRCLSEKETDRLSFSTARPERDFSACV